MVDREKVIKELEQFKADFKPFCGNSSDWARVDNAISMLKEQPEIVRCKDCKHRPKENPFTTTWGGHDTYLEFPEGSQCPCQCSDDEYYSWYPDDTWFCASGERRED